MIKIKREVCKKNSVDFILEDGTELYTEDWNTEIYKNGFKNNKLTNLCYKPVFTEIEDECFEIIGFEVIYK